jgi:hypothetical protein
MARGLQLGLRTRKTKILKFRKTETYDHGERTGEGDQERQEAGSGEAADAPKAADVGSVPHAH